MHDPVFRRSTRPLSLAAVAAHGAALLPAETDAAMLVTAAATLASARPGELAAAGDADVADDLRATRAGVVFVSPRHLAAVPAGTVALVTDDPLRAFFRVATLIDPESRGFGFRHADEAGQRHALVHGEARIERGATLGPGAVIGPGVEIGAGTAIGANCVVDADVRIGRDCAIGPLVTLSHALLGDDVVVHAGARIGIVEPGAPRLGRAILQNAVEIGANAVVARGAAADTVLGEGAVVEASAIVASDTIVARGAIVRARR